LGDFILGGTMKFIRYQLGSGESCYGWVLEDRVGQLDGTPLGEYRRLDLNIPLENVKLLPPVLPGKIIGVGRNYIEHAKEHNVEIPDTPLLFLKPPSSIIGPEEAIILPPQSHQVEHEGELAVVIGKEGRWIQPEKAHEYILGFTIGNDVTARDLQRKDGQWTRGKGFDTFCPLGPWIETDLDVSDTLITCRVNQGLRQMSSTKEMVFSVDQLIAYSSSIMTLFPGDVILTGTPAGVGPLQEGDIVEVKVEGIGLLRNHIKNSVKDL
jgi:2-keto-4-pentenoate hydratase/2-oxohepta-3-ene-1,7-dioic acid hydratase in catechol pathway